MLVSKCCSADVRVEGHTTHYYVCNQCDRATDGKFSIDLGGLDDFDGGRFGRDVD